MYDPLAINSSEQKGNVKYDPLGLGKQVPFQEKEFKAKHPNVYAGLKTASDFIPFSKYLDPDERDRFMRLSQKGQTNELLHQTLEAELLVAFPKILEGVGNFVAPVFQRFFPKTYKFATQDVKNIKIKQPKTEAIPNKPAYDPLKINESFEQDVRKAAIKAEKNDVRPVEDVEIAPVPKERLNIEPEVRLTKDLPKELKAEKPVEKVEPTANVEGKATQAENITKPEMPLEGKPKAIKPTRTDEVGVIISKWQSGEPRYQNTNKLINDIEDAVRTRKVGETKEQIASNKKVLNSIDEYRKVQDVGGDETVASKSVLDSVHEYLKLPKPETLEAMVKGGKTGDTPKYAGTNLNLERLDTTNDVKHFIDGFAKVSGIEKKKVSWEETVRIAKDLAWDEREFLKQARIKKGFNTPETLAMREVNVTVLDDLFKTLRDMPADVTQRTDSMRLSALEKIDNAVQIMKAYTEKTSEAGRTLNIYRKMVKENPDFMADKNKERVFRELFNMNGGKKLTDDMISDLQKVDFSNPIDVKRVLQKYYNASIGDKLFEAWLNGILSAPTSHMANIIGNSLTIATKVPETIVSNLVRGKLPAGEIVAEVVGLAQGFKEGIRAGMKAFVTGMPRDMISKIEHTRYSAIKGLKGEIIRVPTKALTGADEFFKAIVYRSEVNRLAYSQARKEGAQNVSQRMAEIISDPIASKPIHEKARQEALYRTFQKPLGNIGTRIMGLRDSVYPLKFIIPFIKTPTNIAKFTLERTPANFAKLAHDYALKKITAEEFSNELAKPIVGSLIAVATALYALDGTITGGAPKNKLDKELKYATGWQPYAIKINGKYYSYNRLEPVGSLMGMTADFIEASQGMDERDINETVALISMSVARNLTSKTFMSGLTKALDALSDPDRYGGDYIAQLSGSVIPAVVASTARATDPYVREVNTPLDAIQARIPNLSQKLPYKEGAYGMPIENSPSGLTGMFLPMRMGQESPFKDLAEVELETRKIERIIKKEQDELKKILSRERRH